MKKNTEFSKAPVDRYEIYVKMQAILCTVGQRIRDRRTELNLSRSQIEKDLEIGPTLARVEIGVFGNINSIYKIVQYLGLDFHELFAEPFTFSEKPSYGTITRQNKILKKMLEDAGIKNINRNTNP